MQLMLKSQYRRVTKAFFSCFNLCIFWFWFSAYSNEKNKNLNRFKQERMILCKRVCIVIWAYASLAGMTLARFIIVLLASAIFVTVEFCRAYISR